MDLKEVFKEVITEHNKRLNDLLKIYNHIDIKCPHCRRRLGIYYNAKPLPCAFCGNDINYMQFWKPINFTLPGNFVKLMQIFYQNSEYRHGMKIATPNFIECNLLNARNFLERIYGTAEIIKQAQEAIWER